MLSDICSGWFCWRSTGVDVAGTLVKAARIVVLVPGASAFYGYVGNDVELVVAAINKTPTCHRDRGDEAVMVVGVVDLYSKVVAVVTAVVY